MHARIYIFFLSELCRVQANGIVIESVCVYGGLGGGGSFNPKILEKYMYEKKTLQEFCKLLTS